MQTMTTFMPPPPAATFLAFHPQDNNIIAIGMDDSSIQIYNVRVDEVPLHCCLWIFAACDLSNCCLYTIFFLCRLKVNSKAILKE
jgi:hypothetical protein